MNKLLLNCNADCECFLINPETCEVLEVGIQELTSQGVIVAENMFTIKEVATLEIPYDQAQPLEIPYNLTPMTISIEPVVPLIIIVPTPFPFEDLKAVPCIYDSAVYIYGKKVEDESLESKEPTVNIVRTGGVI